MALIGHWVAADAGGAGTNLPDRSASAAHGTLTAGCTWTTIAGEAAVNCPDGDYVSVPDDARWTLGDLTCIVRVAFNSASGQAGVLSHNPGGGLQPKWAWFHDDSPAGSRIYMNDAANSNEYMSGSTWSRSADTIYALGFKRSGNNYSLYRAKAADGTAVGVSTLPFDVASVLKLFYGGESFFGGAIKGISLRVYDAALIDQDIFDAMDEDAGSVIRRPAAGAVSIMGAAPSVEKTGERIPGTAALAITGLAPVLVENVFRSPAVGALALTGAAPNVLQQNLVTPGVGALALAGATPIVEGLADFIHTLEFAPLINGGRFTYAHLLTVLQAPLPDYAHVLVAVAALPDYAHTLRSVPALDPLFSDDVQRTYAEAEIA